MTGGDGLVNTTGLFVGNSGEQFNPSPELLHQIQQQNHGAYDPVSGATYSATSSNLQQELTKEHKHIIAGVPVASEEARDGKVLGIDSTKDLVPSQVFSPQVPYSSRQQQDNDTHLKHHLHHQTAAVDMPEEKLQVVQQQHEEQESKDQSIPAEGSLEKLSNPPMSPVSESSSGMGNNLSGVGTVRSISAAVSNESVAGDSGVFEASMRRYVSNRMASFWFI